MTHAPRGARVEDELAEADLLGAEAAALEDLLGHQRHDGVGVVEQGEDLLLRHQVAAAGEGDQRLLPHPIVRIPEAGRRRLGRRVDGQPAQARDGRRRAPGSGSARSRTTGAYSPSFHCATACSSTGIIARPGAQDQSRPTSVRAAIRTSCSRSASPAVSSSNDGGRTRTDPPAPARSRTDGGPGPPPPGSPPSGPSNLG
jgi:hypothetical protein